MTVRLAGSPARFSGPHPLGPLFLRVQPLAALSLRFWAGVILTGAVLVLGLAAGLRPDGRGYGTHEQFAFIGPCGLLCTTGIPCPTCGMTTAFAYAVRGQLWRAARAQPLGCLLALLAMAAAVLAGQALVTGRSWTVNWYRISPMKLVAAFALLFLGAWGYKILAVFWWPG